MRAPFLALGFAGGLALSPFTETARDRLDDLMAPLSPTAVAMPVCAPVAVNLYFQQGETALDGSGQSVLDAVSQRVRGCTIASVAIESQPAAVASAEGRRVAGLRGATVLRTLSNHGVAPAAILITQSETAEPAGAVTPDRVRISVIPATGAVAPHSRRDASVPDNEV